MKAEPKSKLGNEFGGFSRAEKWPCPTRGMRGELRDEFPSSSLARKMGRALGAIPGEGLPWEMGRAAVIAPFGVNLLGFSAFQSHPPAPGGALGGGWKILESRGSSSIPSAAPGNY